MDSTLTALMKINKTHEPKDGIFYNDGTLNSDATNPTFATPYPACSMWWGNPNAPVRLLDLSAMAYYAYAKDKTDFDRMLKESFISAKEVHFDDFKQLPRIVASRVCNKTTSTE